MYANAATVLILARFFSLYSAKSSSIPGESARASKRIGRVNLDKGVDGDDAGSSRERIARGGRNRTSAEMSAVLRVAIEELLPISGA